MQALWCVSPSEELVQKNPLSWPAPPAATAPSCVNRGELWSPVNEAFETSFRFEKPSV